MYTFVFQRKKILTSVLLVVFFCLIPSNSSAEKDYPNKQRPPVLVIDGSQQNFTAVLAPQTGGAHSDGVVDVRLAGLVCDEQGNAVGGAKFNIIDQWSFSSILNEKVVFLANDEGMFLSTVFVGASFNIGSVNDGLIYQTSPVQVRVSKEGYDSVVFQVDFGIPRMRIVLSRSE